MSQPARRADPASETPVSGVRLRRRPTSQVVVRSGDGRSSESGEVRMPHVPTLVGHVPEELERRVTLVGLTAPVWVDDEPMEPLPARSAKRERRPAEILIEDVDQELAERYRREAARILAAGYFS